MSTDDDMRLQLVNQRSLNETILETPKTCTDMFLLVKRLVSGTIDDLGRWKIERLMDHKTGLCFELEELMEQSKKTCLMLHAYMKYYGYGVEKDDGGARSMFQLGSVGPDRYGFFHYMLGRCLMYGRGGVKDTAKAVQCYREAARRGCGFAAFRLGICYDQATDVEQSYAIALKCFTYAHENGHPGSTYWLATLYHFGQGVPKDLAHAVYLYKIALECNETHCMGQLRIIEASHPKLLIPFDQWRPSPTVHMWVPDHTRREIKCLLLCSVRSNLFHQLPHGLILHMCYYLSCRPDGPVTLSRELLASANAVSCVSRLSRQVQRLEGQTAARLNAVEDQLAMMQQTMSAILQHVTREDRVNDSSAEGQTKKPRVI